MLDTRGLRCGFRGLLGVGAATLTLLAAASPAAAKTPRAARGADISYPQCGSPLPKHQTFGVVGVNHGLANNSNNCLGSEVKWAASSPGLTNPAQAAASLYINTADPGPGVADWPHSGSSATYGSCHGSWSKACAYLYGERRASYSFGLVNTIDPDLASTSPWWLDIETVNSWATSSTTGYKGLNIATIRGFIDGLIGAGAPAPVGVYSTATEWRAITGLSPSKTAPSLEGTSPPAWISGTGTLKDARQGCSSAGFTGRRPALAQYAAGGFDADLRCG